MFSLTLITSPALPTTVAGVKSVFFKETSPFSYLESLSPPPLRVRSKLKTSYSLFLALLIPFNVKVAFPATNFLKASMYLTLELGTSPSSTTILKPF